ncbi:MAG TPA: N-acetylmuramoyl-L-alanine amidase [Patescibacteria group bacterium]|nr:N-acetylmuramoyl-L-alanine amidase [Patescibacteria group bacterium]
MIRLLTSLIMGVAVVCLFLSPPVLAETSGKPGVNYPGTCAEPMADVPQKDCSVSTYDDEQWYKDAVAPYIANKLTEIDFVGNKILVEKTNAEKWKQLAKEISACPEVKDGKYPIKTYDQFCCRLQYGTSKLSLHAYGKAVDINIDTNPWVAGHKCKSNECDIPPCVLKALKNNDFSWGGSWAKPCDGQHIEWTGTGSNIKETDLTVCHLSPEVATYYGGTSGAEAVAKAMGDPVYSSGEIADTVDEIKALITSPAADLQITLPGLSLSEPSDIVVQEEAGVDGLTHKFLYIPFFGEYLAAVYRYGVVVIAILAIVMIIKSGFDWSMSGGSPEKITQAKKRIGEALLGVFLALGSYTVLYSINPELVNFRSLRVQYIEEELEGDARAETISFQSNIKAKPTKGTVFCAPDGIGMVDAKGKTITQEQLNAMADGPWPFYETDHGIYERKGGKPDIVIIHSTDGTNFLNAIAKTAGPAVHYVIDRDGSITQSILEKHMAGSVRSGPVSSLANKRSISYELVNLNALCGNVRFQNIKNYRYSGNTEDIKKIKDHPRCLTVTPLQPQVVTKTCECSNLPAALSSPGPCSYAKTSEARAKACKIRACWEKFPDAQMEAVAYLTARMVVKYNIPIRHSVTTNPPAKNCPQYNRTKECWDLSSGIIGHADIPDNSHGDPGPAFDWPVFLKMVEANVPQATADLAKEATTKLIDMFDKS